MSSTSSRRSRAPCAALLASIVSVGHECGSSPELGKLLSLLLALDTDQDVSNGITVETTQQVSPAVALGTLSETSLLATPSWPPSRRLPELCNRR